MLNENLKNLLAKCDESYLSTHSCYGWKWHFLAKKALHNIEKHS